MDLADEIFESLDLESDESFDVDDGEQELDLQEMLPGQRAELERRIAEYEAAPSIAMPIERILAEMEAYKMKLPLVILPKAEDDVRKVFVR